MTHPTGKIGCNPNPLRRKKMLDFKEKAPGRTRLVITRKHGEAVHIGDNVTVHVRLDHEQDRVKLTIDAPPEVHILRDELKRRANTAIEQAENDRYPPAFDPFGNPT